MYFRSTAYFLVFCQFLLIVCANDDGQWKKEDLPNKEETAMDEGDEPSLQPERTKKSFDLNSTIIDDKKLDDLKNVKDNIQAANDTMGRSNYGLDELLDAKRENDKEGRIMNADDEGVLEKPRMNIQGFIPVVGLAGAAALGGAVLNSASASQKRQRLFSSSSSSQDSSFTDRFAQFPPYSSNFMTSEHNQYQQNRFNPPSRTERRRFSSTLQNLASSISGGVNKLTRRGSKQQQTVDYSSFASECICVPIYMCRSGFIEQTAKNQPGRF